jgi:hypothetical protein
MIPEDLSEEALRFLLDKLHRRDNKARCARKYARRNMAKIRLDPDAIARDREIKRVNALKYYYKKRK